MCVFFLACRTGGSISMAPPPGMYRRSSGTRPRGTPTGCRSLFPAQSVLRIFFATLLLACIIHPASRGVAAHTAGLFRSVRGAKGGFPPWGLFKLRSFNKKSFQNIVFDSVFPMFPVKQTVIYTFFAIKAVNPSKTVLLTVFL